MYRRYKFVLLLICLIWMAPINAQLKLSVNAPSVVEANPSYFQIKYTLNSDYAISFEDISDFHFLLPTSRSSLNLAIVSEKKTSTSTVGQEQIAR